MESTNTDGDGGFYRGEYYEEDQISLIRQAEEVCASIESRRDVLIARGDDPDAMIAKIEREMEQMFARWADLRETQDALLDSEVKCANATRNLAMSFCRIYLTTKEGYDERLAKLPFEKREQFQDTFEQLEAYALGCFDLLPTDDRELLRREGWGW